MNDSKDFQDAESIRSGNSIVTRPPVSFSPGPGQDYCKTKISPGSGHFFCHEVHVRQDEQSVTKIARSQCMLRFACCACRCSCCSWSIWRNKFFVQTFFISWERDVASLTKNTSSVLLGFPHRLQIGDNSVTAKSSLLSPTGGVKGRSPTQENFM